MTSIINLDSAAGISLTKESKKAVKSYLEEPQVNPDSAYAPAVELRRDLSLTKNKIAKLLGTNSPNIFITSGSSDANSRLLSLIKSAQKDLEIITTEIEHSTLLEEISSFNNYKIIKLDSKTHKLEPSAIQKAISDKTVLITVQYVNNETGQVLPIKELFRLVQKVRKERLISQNKTPLFLHTDASQAAITQDLDINRLGIDALSLNGSKFGALPSTGILYLSADLLRWLGTKKVEIKLHKENPLSIISLCPALQKAIQKRPTETKRLLGLSKTFHQEFIEHIPEARLNPANLKIGKNHSAHILNYTIPNISGEKLVILAGMNGILLSTGAACSASKNKPSHVLLALGLSLNEVNSSVRISLGPSVRSEKEIKEAAQKLAKLCQNSAIRLETISYT